LMDKLRQEYSSMEHFCSKQIIINTFSAGLIESTTNKNYYELIEQADKALYQAKISGKNCMIVK